MFYVGCLIQSRALLFSILYIWWTYAIVDNVIGTCHMGLLTISECGSVRVSVWVSVSLFPARMQVLQVVVNSDVDGWMDDWTTIKIRAVYNWVELVVITICLMEYMRECEGWTEERILKVNSDIEGDAVVEWMNDWVNDNWIGGALQMTIRQTL